MPRSNIKGMDSLLLTLGRVAKESQQVSYQAAEAGGKILEKEIERTTPVRKGNLKRSTDTRPTRDRLGVLVGWFGVSYARFVEFGSRRGARAQHVIRNAIRRTRVKVAQAQRQVIEKWLRRRTSAF